MHNFSKRHVRVACIGTVLSFLVVGTGGAFAASSGIDTASGTTELPFSIEGVAVMTLTGSGLELEAGKSVKVYGTSNGSYLNLFDDGNPHVESGANQTLWINGNSTGPVSIGAGGGDVHLVQNGGTAYANGSKIVKVSDIPTCTENTVLKFDGTTLTCVTASTPHLVTGSGCNACPYGSGTSSDNYWAYVTSNDYGNTKYANSYPQYCKVKDKDGNLSVSGEECWGPHSISVYVTGSGSYSMYAGKMNSFSNKSFALWTY